MSPAAAVWCTLMTCWHTWWTLSVHNLQHVFTDIHQAGLSLNPKMCSLLHRETTFLGHVVGPSGVATDPKKVAAVRD